MKLIDKDALVAEIERRKDVEVDYDESSLNFASYADQIHYSTLDSIEDFINTLEVKEVDLEKEISNYLYSHLGRPRMALELDWSQYDISCKADKLVAFAQHFFEFGLKMNQKLKTNKND